MRPFFEALQQGATELGLDLTEEQLGRLLDYLDLLIEHYSGEEGDSQVCIDLLVDIRKRVQARRNEERKKFITIIERKRKKKALRAKYPGAYPKADMIPPLPASVAAALLKSP